MAAKKQIKDIMTTQLQIVPEKTTLQEVARLMRDQRIGDVLVTDAGGKLCGIVTDRDVVVRAVAEGKDLGATTVREVCSDQVTTLQPDASIDQAVQLMRDHSVRRIPVVRDDVPVGIVSIGDLARQQDPRSALAEISAAPANN